MVVAATSSGARFWTRRLDFVNLRLLLPAYRGAAPVPWAILKETVSRASVFQLDRRFDTGAILGRVRPHRSDGHGGELSDQARARRSRPDGGDGPALADGTARTERQDNGPRLPRPQVHEGGRRNRLATPFAEIERRV